VDDAIAREHVKPSAAPGAPAFFGPRWNGWTLCALAVVCILGFFVTQTLLLVWVLFRDHPDFLRYPAELQRQLQNPSFVTDLLTAKNLWIISVFSEAALALMTIGLAQAAFRANLSNLGLRAIAGRYRLLLTVGVGVSAGVGLFLASSLVELAMTKILGPHPPQPQALALVKHHGLFAFMLDFMSVGIAAPIAEELFFRGFVFAGLAQRMSPFLAMTISAVLFGGAHLEKWSFLPIVVIGFGLAWVYYSTRSLWVNIVSHSTVNTVSLIVAFLYPQLVK
jgi:membrane protease YdiL (CAAX protease family)